MSNPYFCVFTKMLDNTLAQNLTELAASEHKQNIERERRMTASEYMRKAQEIEEFVMKRRALRYPLQRPFG